MKYTLHWSASQAHTQFF